VKTAYDVVIIGSGFGGSIPAYRLAHARRAAGKPVSICVLERGKRYNRGEFPRDFSRPKDWWWRHEGERGWRGLIEYRSFDNILTICGSGVGGTSLMYLDVQINAFDSDFDVGVSEGRPRWPQSVNWRAELPLYYRRMEEMLRPTPMPEPNLKARALKAAADGLGEGARHRLLDLAIYWGHDGGQGVWHSDPYGRGGPGQFSCSHCGECFIGCNTHSKNTLDLNYLWLAERAGTEVYSQHKVTSIAPHDGGYRIDYKDLRWAGFTGSVLARQVVVACGSVGSTELLLRCRHGYRRDGKRIDPTLPYLSPMLGQYFSANGDFGAMGFETSRQINPMEGPTITSVLDYGDKLNNRGFIVEDGGFPDVLRANLKRLPGGIASARRWLRVLKNLVGRATGTELVEGLFNQLDFETIRDGLPYLVMGADAADGEMSLGEEGRLRIDWHHPASMPLWREIESTLRRITESESALNGNLMLNPAWSAQKQVGTVHPLGGCPMGEDVSRGVVSPDGQVFGYPNLYVTDGSIVPTAIGPNPSKTIGALAERISEKIIQNWGTG
jgi:cholesterol oxidase